MNDPYGTFVDSAVGKRLAKALGLPMPVQLRRHTPGAPLLEGPALVLGGGVPARHRPEERLDPQAGLAAEGVSELVRLLALLAGVVAQHLGPRASRRRTCPRLYPTVPPRDARVAGFWDELCDIVRRSARARGRMPPVGCGLGPKLA